MKNKNENEAATKEGNKIFCVVSHTHWDREWYMPLEQFRIRLVELMDRLFDIIEQNPVFIFHLDAQTIVLEDYLAIRPWRRALLEKHIKAGNLVVGPWYLQNDFYLTSGEATVRNLLIGTAIAEEFGNCGKVGYAPDQFGNISQLPQILSQFGVDNFIFGRGYGTFLKDKDGNTVRENTPAEFLWEGPDGSRLLAIHMKYWYNNAQRIYSDMEKAIPLLETIEKLFDGVALTPYLLLMNGVDHLEAQDDLIPVIDQINRQWEQIRLEEAKSDNSTSQNLAAFRDDIGDSSTSANQPPRLIRQYKMEDYVREVESFFENEKVPMRIQKGELRDGHDWELLKGTLSSRIYLKQQNIEAQNNLECCLEPMSALYELAGAANTYDSDYMLYLWKELLKNHPHDSICGCSRDEVHNHMEDNYEKLGEATSYLLSKKTQDIANHMEANTKDSADNIIMLANTLAISREEVVEVEVLFLRSENVEAFRIVDINGESQEFIVTKTEFRLFDVFTALNLPGVLDVKAFTILLSTRTLEGFSCKGLIVRKTDEFEAGRQVQPVLPGLSYNTGSVIGNEHIQVEATPKGEVHVTFLKTGVQHKNAIQIEDLPDRGDAYVFFKTDDEPIYGTDFPVTVTCVDKNPLRQIITINYAMRLPDGYDFANRKRSEKTIDCPFEMSLVLKKGSPVLEIETKFENTARNHRIRLVVDTGILSDESFADIPFDIVSHPVEAAYPDTMSDVHPNTSFAAIMHPASSTQEKLFSDAAIIYPATGSDDKASAEFVESSKTGGIAVFTTGAHEYEHLSNKRSMLAFTLVRATGHIQMGADLNPGGGSQWSVPENQCLRVLKNRFGIHCFPGDGLSSLPALAQAFRVQVQTTFASCDAKKFSGGRFAIQGSSMPEFYYLPDLHPELKIKDNKSIVKVEGTGVLVTALKKSEDKKGFVLRMVNMNDTPAKIQVGFDGAISRTTLSETTAKSLGRTLVGDTLRPKEIASFLLETN